MIKKVITRFANSPTLINWINQFAIFVHGIFITSLILIKFSNLDYSFWMLLKTLTYFGILAEAGLGSTIERSVAFFFSGATKLPRNRKDYDAQTAQSDSPNVPQLAQLLYTTKYIYLIISGFTILLLSTAGVAFLWNLFDQSGHDRGLWVAFVLMIFQTLIVLQNIKWRSFMTGTRHLVEYYRFNTIVSVVRIFGFLVLLLSGLEVMHLMMYLVVEQAVIYYYCRGFMTRWFERQGYKLKNSFRLNKGIFSSLWSVSWKSGLNTWGFFFTNRGVELITSQLKDTALMASFLFTSSILGFIRTIAQTPITVKYPELFGLMSGKKFDQVKREASPRILLSLVIMIAGFASFGLLGNWLLDLIGAESKSLVPATIFILMSFFLIMESHALIHGTIYISTNAVPFLIPGLITGIATFVFGMLVLPRWGLLGLVTLQVLLNLGNNFWYSSYLSLKLTRWPFTDYLKDIAINGPKYWLSRFRNA